MEWDWRAHADALGIHGAAADLVALAVIAAAAFLLHVTIGFAFRRTLHRFVTKTRVTWDDALARSGLFHRVVHLIPLAAVWFGERLLRLEGLLATIVDRALNVVLVILVARVLDGVLNAAQEVYGTRVEARARPIKGYVQVARIFLWTATTVVAIAAAADKSPLLFLSGIGAMTAVLLLVFKDTILGLVASVQLAGNDMIRVGDWIEVPSAGADGDVIDIALHTVKVQNWDKTITTIPTYSLISEGFKNWRGMAECGGRRIKRSVIVDQSSIRHLRDDEVGRLRGIRLIHDYVVAKERGVHDTNAGVPGESKEVATNLRRLTNIGTYRAYVQAYLRAHPKIHKDFTLMVRQLAPVAEGLPLELYCFTATTAWVEYENIQADIFDHIIAVAAEFDLRVFQAPSSHDVRALEAALRPPTSASSQTG